MDTALRRQDAEGVGGLQRLGKLPVEDGVIVGTTAEGSPNSFLCTKKEYGDFVLEFETQNDPALNSGVQIRSHRYAEEKRSGLRRQTVR